MTSPSDTPVVASLRLALAAAAGSLLAGGAGQVQALELPEALTSHFRGDQPWQVDAAAYSYQEADGRVKAFEPMVFARHTDAQDRILSLRATLDTLSGASPNGAAPQQTPQTFTRPSGNGSYATEARKIPFDPAFKDFRVAFGGTLDRPWGQDRRLATGLNASFESDFTSFSGNAAVSRDYNNKNTTLSYGGSLELDFISPKGLPKELQPITTQPTGEVEAQRRVALELIGGVTQVMTRRWLTQFNASLGFSSGYHTDPYKVVSILDGSGLITGDQYVGEARPTTRTRASLFWQHKVHLNEDVIDASYRWYRDSWGITSQTVDLRYRFETNLAGGLYLEPHWRGYRQSAADFYRPWLNSGSDYTTGVGASVSYASADPRLAALTATTVGLKLGLPLANRRELGLRLENYQQIVDQPAVIPVGIGTDKVAPDLKATVLVLNYSFEY